MSKNEFDQQVDAVLNGLRDDPPDLELSGFEHGVWSEIAIRDGEASSQSGWLSRGFSLPASAMAACAGLAILLGSAIGLTRAEAYGKEASLAVERRYVESIHPVMMSANHASH